MLGQSLEVGKDGVGILKKDFLAFESEHPPQHILEIKFECVSVFRADVQFLRLSGMAAAEARWPDHHGVAAVADELGFGVFGDAVSSMISSIEALPAEHGAETHLAVIAGVVYIPSFLHSP